MTHWWQDAWTIVADPLALPLVLPALAGLVAYVCARRLPLVSALMSLIASAAALGLTIHVLLTPGAVFDTTLVRVHEFRIAVVMVSGALGAMIAAGCAFFSLLVAIYALGSERGLRYEGRFHALLCWTLAGAIGAALADDLIWLLLCWEVVSLCLYLLLNAGRPAGAAGAAKTFAMIGLGDAAMLLALALIAAAQGTTRISELSIVLEAPSSYLCYLLFVAASLAKAGAIPLHSWIPAAAHHGSASVFALLPASIDKLLGIYLLARFSLEVFVLDASMKALLMIIGGTTVLAAVLMAMVQHHLKALLSFHAVSQVGYMVMGIGTGMPIGIIGGMFHMVNNAIYKSCLFLSAGVIEKTGGTDDLNRLGGLARKIPVTFICCLTAALAISGIPPLNGFVSKWLIYQGCLDQSSWLAMLCLVVVVFGSALTLASFFKVITSVFWGPATATGDARQDTRLHEGFSQAAPMVVLALLCIGFGVFATWPLQALILPAVNDLGVPLDQMAWVEGAIQPADLGLWSPAPATGLILLGVLGGVLFYMIGRVGQARVADLFVGGESVAAGSAMRLPASSFYRTVEELPGVGEALRDGSRGVFDVYRLGGRYGATLVDVLKARHTGVLSLYVSWCLFGAGIIVVYLMFSR
jgi:formate hydrogenlyase subunit 3/multisubunit Na+/H+ antiporter MnhD subunit